MTLRVEVSPDLLRWACDRAGPGLEGYTERFPKLEAWVDGTTQPTLKQLESFAKATYTPIGFLFLDRPPELAVPIPDLRTVGNARLGRPSPDLLETLYLCQQRQEWYHGFARSVGEERLAFVGSARLQDDVVTVATRIRSTLDFDLEERRRILTWTDALRRFIEQADVIGVLVMVNGIVGNNTHRKLDPDEFRGFALSDDLAPLVFVNGADTKAAQMFTLAHELAHLWLGESALSDVGPLNQPSHRIEVWCNQVAAEVLMPLEALRHEQLSGTPPRTMASRLARNFKVSTLVVLRRMHDAGWITRETLRREYAAELEHLRPLARGSGGDFYLTQAVRVGKRFARALVVSTLEGQTLHRDAFHLLGITKTRVLDEMGRNLGVI